MKRQYTLKVYPAGQSRTVYRVLEVPGDDTLDELCSEIINAFDFAHEHMYEFCMDNRMYGGNSYMCRPEEDEPSTDIEIDRIGLNKGQNFSLHYDFGDDWMFTIHVQKIEDVPEYFKPRVIKEKGTVRQYPDWDEEE